MTTVSLHDRVTRLEIRLNLVIGLLVGLVVPIYGALVYYGVPRVINFFLKGA